MGEWYQTFDSVFWLSISTCVFGFLAVVVKTALKSKCDQSDFCWGLVKIHRRVELEKDDDDNKPSSVKVNV